jgi:hypothetical protein
MGAHRRARVVPSRPLMRRCLAAVLTSLVLLATAAPAIAQDNPFAPPTLPQPTAAPTATATPDTSSNGDTTTGTRTLYFIGAALLLSFVAIGVWISRDARRSIPEHRRGRHTMAEPVHADGSARRRDPKAKARARAKARAQRKARRYNR